MRKIHLSCDAHGQSACISLPRAEGLCSDDAGERSEDMGHEKSADEVCSAEINSA